MVLSPGSRRLRFAGARRCPVLDATDRHAARLRYLEGFLTALSEFRAARQNTAR